MYVSQRVIIASGWTYTPPYSHSDICYKWRSNTYNFNIIMHITLLAVKDWGSTLCKC